jgi:phage shock protein PspC (stress-responsive transcriptional regulator)
MNDSEMKNCPFCDEQIRMQATKCRHCKSLLTGASNAREWCRDREQGKIAGVCAGLANQVDVTVTLIRLAFVISAFWGGWGLVIYVILWLIMPEGPALLPSKTPQPETTNDK